MDSFRNRTIEGAMRFLLWAQSLHDFPTALQIAEKLGCSRACAYRYRQTLADAMGIPCPPNPPHGYVPETHRPTNPRGVARVFQRENAQ